MKKNNVTIQYCIGNYEKCQAKGDCDGCIYLKEIRGK